MEKLEGKYVEGRGEVVEGFGGKECAWVEGEGGWGARQTSPCLLSLLIVIITVVVLSLFFFFFTSSGDIAKYRWKRWEQRAQEQRPA